MKKVIITFSYLVSFCLIIYFWGVICLNNYFNNSFYKTPNFLGMTKNEVEKIIPKKEIIIKEIGRDYSDFPYGEIFRQEPEKGKIVKKGRIVKIWISLGKNSIKIPDFKGTQLYEVRNYLEEKKIKIKNISRIVSELPYNSVITTTPAAGEIININEGISILLSNKVSNKMIKMPDIIGYKLEEAVEILKMNFLFVGEITRKNISGLDKNIVINSNIDFGKNISAGSSVDLVVTEK